MRSRSRLLRFSLILCGLALITTIVFPTGINTLRVGLAEQQWQAQQIHDYRIQVQISGAWMEMLVDTTVKEGQIVHEICTTAGTVKPCDFTADYNYTVPGLFALARVGSPLAARTIIPASVASCLSITFDSTFHYPVDMQHDCRRTLDDEWTASVQSFERIK
jgi:hypothetical protein